MSTIVGNVVLHAQEVDPSIPGHVIASALAVICGCIIVAIGLARMGWIVDLISLTAITAFMTGSAISIAAGQVPTMMGISSRLNTRDPTYLVIINTLRQLGHSTLDAAMGLTALTMLYIIRYACQWAAKKHPNQKKTFFFISTLRTVFVILLYTMISWLVNKDHRQKPLFKILGTVPRGRCSIMKPPKGGPDI
jgi:sodium-independent sulfate anion transporter 11